MFQGTSDENALSWRNKWWMTHRLQSFQAAPNDEHFLLQLSQTGESKSKTTEIQNGLSQ